MLFYISYKGKKILIFVMFAQVGEYQGAYKVRNGSFHNFFKSCVIIGTHCNENHLLKCVSFFFSDYKGTSGKIWSAKGYRYTNY